MTKLGEIKSVVAGKAKRLVGEIVGDQKLDDEGKAEEQRSRELGKGEDRIRPLGNLGKLT